MSQFISSASYHFSSASGTYIYPDMTFIMNRPGKRKATHHDSTINTNTTDNTTNSFTLLTNPVSPSLSTSTPCTTSTSTSITGDISDSKRRAIRPMDYQLPSISNVISSNEGDTAPNYHDDSLNSLAMAQAVEASSSLSSSSSSSSFTSSPESTTTTLLPGWSQPTCTSTTTSDVMDLSS